MLNVAIKLKMPGVIMLSVVLLNVVMQSVLAPPQLTLNQLIKVNRKLMASY